MKLFFGVKIIAKNKNLLLKSLDLVDKELFDYIELLLTPEFTLTGEFIDKLSNIKLILHAPHENYGVDLGNIKKKNLTIKTIKKSLEWQEKLNADHLIIHCGTGDLEVAKENLSIFKEYREIILENMPVVGINGEICLGYDAKTFEKLNIHDFGLCLDFGHAIKASLSIGLNYREVISEFMRFKPKIFHISDGKLDREIDEHLNIGEGEYDFEFIREIIQKSENNYITLETPRYNQNSLDEDIKNLELISNILS